MIYPSADTIEKMVGSRYSLVILAAKRAKQIKEGAPLLIDTLSTNPLTIALEEIAAGKVTINPASALAPQTEGEAAGDAASIAALGQSDLLGDGLLDETEALDDAASAESLTPALSAE